MIPDPASLPEWNSGDFIYGSDLNKLSRRLMQVFRSFVPNYVEGFPSRNPVVRQVAETWLGTVCAPGKNPDGSADNTATGEQAYTDGRYNVLRGTPGDMLKAGDKLTLDRELIPPSAQRVVASNLFENGASNCHVVPEDGSAVVKVTRFDNRGMINGSQATGWVPNYVFNCIPQYWNEVDLATDGGANASLSGGVWTQASYTYTGTIPGGGAVLFKMQSPRHDRPHALLVGPATRGWVGIVNKSVVLLSTDEQLAVDAACTT